MPSIAQAIWYLIDMTMSIRKETPNGLSFACIVDVQVYTSISKYWSATLLSTNGWSAVLAERSVKVCRTKGQLISKWPFGVKIWPK